MSLRLSPFALLLTLAACGGASAPPPPVASATTPPADELRPLSSRDGGAVAPGATPAQPSAGAMPSNAPLPPGHPAVGQSDPHGNVPSGAVTKSAGSVAGTISVAPKLSVASSDVLYVIAKKGASTVAVRRIAAPKFPLSFEISGSDVMMAGVAFEGPIDIVARVSKSGDAIPGKGDLEGTARGVKVPSKDVSLTIDRVRE